METEKINMYEEFYDSPVQMSDRFETVHIWSKKLALKNNGRWEPKLITIVKYNREKKHSWNQ